MNYKNFAKLLITFTLVSCGGGESPTSQPTMQRDLQIIEKDDFGRIIKTNFSTETLCPVKATAFFVSGQSNAANYAQNIEEVSDNVFYYFGGKCYVAKSPLLGATTDLTGHYFNPFQQVFVDYAKRTGEKVIISVFAVGGSSITKFGKDGIFHESLVKQYREFDSLYPVKYFLWQQGETDNIGRMSVEEYRKYWNEIVAALQIQNKFIMARSTYCSNLTTYDNPIGNFQEQFRGPNTDTLIDPEYRYDNCHFDTLGVKRLSLLWNDKLQ